MHSMRRFFLAAVVLFSMGVGAPKAHAAPLTIDNFQLAAIGAFNGGTNSFFGQFSWTPYVGLGPAGIRGEIGITAFDFGGGRFFATNYEVLLHLPFIPGFAIEGGGGVHVWHNTAPESGAITANLVLDGAGFDRFFIGYTRYLRGTGVNIVRAGIGFEL